MPEFTDSDTAADEAEQCIDEPEMVLVVSRSGNGGRNNIHTDPDCHHVKRAKNVFEKPRSVVDEDRICRTCSGKCATPGATDPNKNRKLLLSMSPGDLGLSERGKRDGEGGGLA